jgi:hypothetical protein
VRVKQRKRGETARRGKEGGGQMVRAAGGGAVAGANATPRLKAAAEYLV